MTEYLISFPSRAMDFPDEDFPAVSDAAYAVVLEARAAGVLIFTGGINEDVAPILVAGDGTVTDGGYPQGPDLNGGYAVLNLDSREEAIEWAAKIARACRCSQEVREFQRGRMS
ncbi:MAG: YciI family protein [Actinomycetota bacterium]